jgi:hypothetical protein
MSEGTDERPRKFSGAGPVTADPLAIEVRDRLRTQMHTAFARVQATADQLGIDSRTAALACAIDHVSEAAKLRAIYP